MESRDERFNSLIYGELTSLTTARDSIVGSVGRELPGVGDPPGYNGPPIRAIRVNPRFNSDLSHRWWNGKALDAEDRGAAAS